MSTDTRTAPSPRGGGRRWLAATAVAFVLLVAAGRARARQGVALPAVRPAADTVQLTFSGVATLEPWTQADVAADLTGRLAALRVAEGDTVRAGDVLAEIAPDGRAVQPEALAGARLQAEARARGAEAAMVAAAQTLARQEALWGTDAAHRFITADEVEGARTHAAQARAEYDLARGQALEVAGQARTAREHDARTVLRAPLTGIVTRRYREVGEVVVPATYGGDVGRVLTIADPRAGRLVLGVPEALALALGRAADRGAVVVRLQARPADTLRATIVRVRPRVGGDPTDGLRFEVELRVDAGGAPLPLGATVLADLATAPVVFAVALPLRVLAPDPAGGDALGVYVAAAGRAVFRRLALGRSGSRSVEVLGGLPADAVVLDASEAERPLAAGVRVRPQPRAAVGGSGLAGVPAARR